ncbi:glycosyltransferase family 4 protein [Thermococcus peptonophilus]|uniref:Glycosyl transferase n=1 Tax=Thermococcus peptonophilus TaxID=53952 RepID=A0A142CVP8_9EURY|nr:glycosyltransferase family 4 protein [Thermococcus peptonophilus]AMQ18850.1 hypothetical protein A0127_06515 [Thermococcus peptonophilus]
MKLLLINYMETTAPGGINKVVFEIARWLSKWSHEVVVFNPAWDNRLQMSEEKIENFTLIRGYKYRESLYGFSIKNIGVVRELIKKFDPDVVHVHGYHTLFSPEIVYVVKKYFSKIPVIFSPHYMPFGHATLLGEYLWSVYNKISNLLIFPKIDHLIVASNFEKDSLLYDIPNTGDIEISVIPHGVDVIDVQKKPQREEITLLFSGYLQERKGVQYILRALYELVYEYKMANVRLTIIGEGPYKQSLLKLAKQLNIMQYIVWKPFVVDRTELFKEIQNADIFLLLSKNENYGITVAEALALGTPVIVTKHSALKEFLTEPGCFGVDYPPNPKKVAELILKILNSDVRVGPFSKRIRTWDEVVKDYEKVYNLVLRRVKNMR